MKDKLLKKLSTFNIYKALSYTLLILVLLVLFCEHVVFRLRYHNDNIKNVNNVHNKQVIYNTIVVESEPNDEDVSKNYATTERIRITTVSKTVTAVANNVSKTFFNIVLKPNITNSNSELIAKHQTQINKEFNYGLEKNQTHINREFNSGLGKSKNKEDKEIDSFTETNSTTDGTVSDFPTETVSDASVKIDIEEPDDEEITTLMPQPIITRKPFLILQSFGNYNGTTRKTTRKPLRLITKRIRKFSK